MIWRLLPTKYEASAENIIDGIQLIIRFELKVENVHKHK